MMLTYRGIRYEAQTTAIHSPRTEVKVKYRGQTYQIPQAKMTAPRPNVKLIYRGIPYYPNKPVTTPALEPQSVIEPQFDWRQELG